jgi:hypothetical protein
LIALRTFCELKRESVIPTLWFHIVPSYYKAFNFNEVSMSMRIMPLMRKNDLALVPRSEDMCKFLDFCVRMFNLSYEQFIFYDSLGEKLFASTIIDPLKKMNTKCSFQELHLYAETSLSRLLQKELDIPRCNVDSEKFGLRYSDKSFLYHLKGVVKVPSYEICHTVSDLRDACHILKDASRLLLKPLIGTGGKGIFIVESDVQLQGYDFEFGPVVLQEYVQPDLDERGFTVSPSVQFVGKEILGIVSQRIKNYSFKGVCCPANISLSTYDLLLAISQELLHIINPQGMGGFDFIVVKNKPMLIDINVGRITGVHPFWDFCLKHDMPPYFLGVPLCATCSLETFFEILKKECILFSSELKSGVVPFGWIPNKFGFVAIFGPNLQEIQNVVQRLRVFFDFF